MKDHLVCPSRPGSDANKKFNESRNGGGYPRITGEMWNDGAEWNEQQNALMMSDVDPRPSR